MQNNYYFEGSETFYAYCMSELDASMEENIEIAVWASQR